MNWQEMDTLPDTDEQVLFWTRGGDFYCAPARLTKMSRQELRAVHLTVYRETGVWPSAHFEPTHWCRVEPPAGIQDGE